MSSNRSRPWRARGAVAAVTALASTATVASFGVVLAAAGPAGASPARPATAPVVGYSARAFGTSVEVAGGVVQSGPSAVAAVGCTSRPGATRTNSVVTVSVPGVVTIGAITDTASTSAPSGDPTASSTSQGGGFSLLGGIVSASAVTATATTTDVGGTFSNTGSTSLVGLTVLGQSFSVDPPPNTRIDLAGIGTLVLNKQTAQVGATGAALTVQAIDLKLGADNSLGLPTGLHLVVGDAASGLQPPVVGYLGGNAFGTELTVGSTVSSGPSALKFLACQGTSGVVKTNTVVGVNVAGVFSTGVVTSSVEGTVGASSSSAETSDTIASVSVDPGSVPIVSVNGITAAAQASASGGTVTLSENGSSLGSLSILGIPFPVLDVPPNTTVPIPGVGTLYLNRVTETTKSITVHMVELVASSGLLPAGSDLIFGSATATIR